MTDHPNLAALRSISAAFTTGDMDALATLFDENVVWHTPGRHALADTYVITGGRCLPLRDEASYFTR